MPFRRPLVAATVSFGRLCSTAAAARSPTVPTQSSDEGPNLQWPRELHFYREFSLCAEDLHAILLEEAHRKHGVHLNVPPQLPPAGSPPEVPDVIFCDKQQARLRSLKLAYAPTHGAPPLATTGTRGLAEMIAAEDAASKTLKAAKPSTSLPSTLPKSPENDVSVPSAKQEVQRRPVDVNNRFHCSLCAKSFRIRLSADHHVAEVHSPSAKASVVDGPGPGEIIPEDEPAKRAEANPADPAASNVKKVAPLPSHVPSPVEYKKRTVAPIPADDEIDGLLTAVWDPVGTQRGHGFKSMAEVVAGVADNRKPLSELDLAPLVRATPEGAAPGIKRVVSSAASGKFTPMKELSARFPNPFGESEEAKILALLKDEPANPFLPVEPLKAEPISGLVAGSPSLAAARASRPFRCPLCKVSTVSFRLLDALADHVEKEHEVEMSPEELIASQDPVHVKRNPYVAVKESKCTASSDVASADGNADGGGLEEDALAGVSLPEGVTADTIPPVPPTVDDVSVHLRASSNIVVVGEVVDVQNGFIQSRRVIQYVVKTSSAASQPQKEEEARSAAPAAPSTASDGSAVQTEELKGGAEPVESSFAEFIVVRVDADGMKFTTDSIRSGMWIMVHGSLRMNRHTDSTSRRLHAYPFVQVCAPLGNLAVVG